MSTQSISLEYIVVAPANEESALVPFIQHMQGSLCLNLKQGKPMRQYRAQDPTLLWTND